MLVRYSDSVFSDLIAIEGSEYQNYIGSAHLWKIEIFPWPFQVNYVRLV
jgi:hypothetical protein